MPAAKSNNGLTEKQEVACQEYIKNKGNRSGAYRSAYNTSNMKPESVNRKAHELFENVKIKARVAELQEDAKKRNNIEIDDLLGHLISYINVNPKRFLKEDGTLKDIHSLSDKDAMAISELIIDTKEFAGSKFVKTKIKFEGKLESIEKIAKHLGMYEKDNKQKQPQVIEYKNVSKQFLNE